MRSIIICVQQFQILSFSDVSDLIGIFFRCTFYFV